MATELLDLKGIHAGYDELRVLSGVDISVLPGEIVALIGPNGAGKSTVLKTIYGITTLTQGKVSFGGKDIAKLKTHELLAAGVSYMPQGLINFGELTVEENLELGGRLLTTEDLHERIAATYKRFPVLERKRKQRTFSLSGGERQMLAIGRALIQRPRLLLMDEPSLGLSPKLQKEVFGIIKSLSHEGIAVLLVEQNAKQAIAIAHRTYLLEQGKIALVGGKEILKDHRIKNVYLGS